MSPNRGARLHDSARLMIELQKGMRPLLLLKLKLELSTPFNRTRLRLKYKVRCSNFNVEKFALLQNWIIFSLYPSYQSLLIRVNIAVFFAVSQQMIRLLCVNNCMIPLKKFQYCDFLILHSLLVPCLKHCPYTKSEKTFNSIHFLSPRPSKLLFFLGFFSQRRKKALLPLKNNNKKKSRVCRKSSQLW